MAGFSILNHKGREIIFLDYKGLTEPDIIIALKQAEEYILKHKKPFLNLSDFTGAFATKGVMEQAAKLAMSTRGYALKGALIGANGAKSVLLKGFNRQIATAGIQTFETMGQALDYLVH